MKHRIPWLITLLLLCSNSVLSATKLTALNHFGDNPGELSASVYLAKNATKTVLLLHGCTQNAEQFAIDSGFLALAKQYQFNLLLPQQSEKNNIKQCFNWFSKQDMSRDSGELLSLKNMITAVKRQTSSEQIYIAGLSAGGAITSALLSIYPQLFNSGAIIAGIPYPCADTLTKAIACMRSGPSQNPPQLAEAVLREHQKTDINWPPLSIWTGTDDKVVNPKNSQFIAKQWLKLNNLKTKPDVSQHKDYQHTKWQNPQGKTIVELLEINGLNHGLMVNPDEDNGGTSGPFLLKSPLSTATQLIKFWGFKQ